MSRQGQMAQRYIHTYIAPILKYIFNECVRLGEMPKILKRTIIKSVYKGKGSKTNPDNYRPISIISATSKLLEKIIYNKLSEYTEHNSLINED